MYLEFFVLIFWDPSFVHENSFFNMWNTQIMIKANLSFKFYKRFLKCW